MRHICYPSLLSEILSPGPWDTTLLSLSPQLFIFSFPSLFYLIIFIYKSFKRLWMWTAFLLYQHILPRCSYSITWFEGYQILLKSFLSLCMPTIYSASFLFLLVFFCLFVFGCPKASGAPSPGIRSKLQPLTKPQQYCIHVPALLCHCWSCCTTARSPDFYVQYSTRSYSTCLTETLCP